MKVWIVIRDVPYDYGETLIDRVYACSQDADRCAEKKDDELSEEEREAGVAYIVEEHDVLISR